MINENVENPPREKTLYIHQNKDKNHGKVSIRNIVNQWRRKKKKMEQHFKNLQKKKKSSPQIQYSQKISLKTKLK